MLKIKFIISFVAMLLPVVAFSQHNFFKGYVVTNSGDTIKGNIRVKDTGETPKSLIYRDVQAKQSQHFSVANCKSFGIYDSEYFERHIVKMTMSSIKIPEVSDGIDTLTKIDTVFLKVLQKGGNVNLYEYSDMLKTRFYIQEKNEVPLELLYYEYFQSDVHDKLVLDYKFQDQLLSLFKKYKLQESAYLKLSKAAYNSETLMESAELINGKKYVKYKYPSVGFFVGAGASSSTLRYTGMHLLASDEATSSYKIKPYFSFGINVYINPAYKQNMLRLELSVMSSEDITLLENNGSSFLTGDSKIKQSIISFAPQFMHNFYNGINNKAFIGAGFSLSYFRTKESIVNHYYHPVGYPVYQESFAGIGARKVNFTVPVTAGILLLNRFELSLGYSFRTKIGREAMYDISQDRYRAGISYLFGSDKVAPR